MNCVEQQIPDGGGANSSMGLWRDFLGNNNRLCPCFMGEFEVSIASSLFGLTYCGG